MTAPPFALLYELEAEKVLVDLSSKRQYATKFKKVREALRLLQQVGPRHPGLHSHAYQSIPAPDGGTLWESHAGNRDSSAWRIWWCCGPAEDQITIVTIGPHP